MKTGRLHWAGRRERVPAAKSGLRGWPLIAVSNAGPGVYGDKSDATLASSRLAAGFKRPGQS